MKAPRPVHPVDCIEPDGGSAPARRRVERIRASPPFQRERKRLDPTGITCHGLRHMVGVRLAKAATTDTAIAAVLEQRTLSMVQHHTRQTALADSALAGRASKAGNGCEIRLQEERPLPG